MRTAVVFLSLVLAVPVLAKDDPSAEARKAIEAANQRFGQATKAGDAVAIGALYAEDAMVFPPDAEAVSGREAIAAFCKSQIAGGVKNAVLTTEKVDRSGDLAAEVGSVAITVQPQGKEAATVRAKYVVVWKHSGGTWQLYRDIWNGLPAEK